MAETEASVLLAHLAMRAPLPAILHAVGEARSQERPTMTMSATRAHQASNVRRMATRWSTAEVVRTILAEHPAQIVPMVIIAQIRPLREAPVQPHPTRQYLAEMHSHAVSARSGLNVRTQIRTMKTAVEVATVQVVSQAALHAPPALHVQTPQQIQFHALPARGRPLAKILVPTAKPDTSVIPRRSTLEMSRSAHPAHTLLLPLLNAQSVQQGKNALEAPL